MNIGKEKCRILKDIRRKLAEANGIKLDIKECKYKGECSGTCPRCESEMRYLERKLYQRQMLGKAVVMAGLTFNIGMFAPTQMIAASPNDMTVIATDNNKVCKYQIKGVVRDEFDYIMGCSVIAFDEHKKVVCGTYSNEKGEFSISVDTLPVEIQFKLIGYSPENIVVTNENYQIPLDVTLKGFGFCTIGEVVEMKVKKRKKTKKQEHSTKQKEMPQNLYRLPLPIETQEEIHLQ